MSLIEKNLTVVKIQKLKEEVKTATKIQKLADQYQKGSPKNIEMATGIVCTYCYRVRNAEGQWIYKEDRGVFDSDATIGYGLCFDCATYIYRKLFAKPKIEGSLNDQLSGFVKSSNGDQR